MSPDELQACFAFDDSLPADPSPQPETRGLSKPGSSPMSGVSKPSSTSAEPQRRSEHSGRPSQASSASGHTEPAPPAAEPLRQQRRTTGLDTNEFLEVDRKAIGLLVDANEALARGRLPSAEALLSAVIALGVTNLDSEVVLALEDLGARLRGARRSTSTPTPRVAPEGSRGSTGRFSTSVLPHQPGPAPAGPAPKRADGAPPRGMDRSPKAPSSEVAAKSKAATGAGAARGSDGAASGPRPAPSRPGAAARSARNSHAAPKPGTPRVEIAIRFRQEASAEQFVCASAPTDALADYRLRQDAMGFARLRTFERLLALAHVRGVDHYDYQLRTVTRVLRDFGGRVLLADEVGLGKTVEACLCLKEYLLRGLCSRALILVPAPLRTQWKSELADKFGIDGTLVGGEESREDPGVWKRTKIAIASLGLARLEPHATQIAESGFEMVIVDEAHRLKNRSTRSWQVVERLKSRFLLLLTATPIENELVEIYNTLTLLRPGLFSTEAAFKKAFVAADAPRKVKDPDKLRALLREVMIRNTRALAEAKLPPRFATTLRAVPGPEEARLYRDLDFTLREGVATGKLGLHVVAEILRAVGSSPGAAAPLLSRRLGPEFAERARSLGRPAKDALLQELLAKREGEKILVFAAQLETLGHLVDLCAKSGRRVVSFHGGLSAAAKDRAIADFARDYDVLVASESGGEGFNLHFARTIVNYDLPWNPMRIEQRIGRVHRIGQTRDVFIFNLVTAGTIEDEILRILDEKINMFELVVGEIEAILGRLGDDEKEFQDLVLELYARGGEGAELRQRLDEFAEELVKAKSAHADVKAFEDRVFGRDLEV